MKVKLVSYSKLHEPIEGVETIQDLVAYFARVSNPKNQINSKPNGKLIKYLLDNKHFSPFEMVNICLEVVTTRDISRQLLRHRSFSFQEFSQRYSNIRTMDRAFEIREARLQDTTNRQNSIETDDVALQEAWERHQEAVIHTASTAYDWAIKNGIAKEQARTVLPEGLSLTKLYMTGSLRSWIHYLDVRTLKSTQKEHRELAEEMASVIAEVVPLIDSTFNIPECPKEDKFKNVNRLLDIVCPLLDRAKKLGEPSLFPSYFIHLSKKMYDDVCASGVHHISLDKETFRGIPMMVLDYVPEDHISVIKSNEL